jgi:acyl transferase domain-containing protein/NADPH:quinone reductase-like Zn-dependent oxidoreductase/acyl carrier protein
VLEHRAVVIGGDRDQLVSGLKAVAAGEQATGVVSGVVPAGGVVRVGFVFTGQGAQRAGMGAGLYAASAVFAAEFDRVCGLLEGRLGLPVADVVLGRDGRDLDGRADQTVFAQAGLFAIEVGLVAMLAAAGIRPDAVAGHSVGEIAAAYAAGVVSLEDACALVAARGQLMQDLPPGGAMVAVGAGEAEVTAALDGTGGVSVAAVNGPSSVVISGDAAAVEAVAEEFRVRGVRVKPLSVSHAFHSHRMDPVLAGLGQVAAGIQFAVPRVPWACGLTGELLAACEPGYWVRQARESVRFADAVTTLAAQGVSVFMELGPDGTLSAMGPAALDEESAAVFVPLLRAGRDAPESVLSALAEMHVRGAGVDWAVVLGGGRPVELPTYAFQRQRYWPTPARSAGDVSAAGLAAVEHPLLGATVELAGGAGLVLTGLVSVRSAPWLADYVVAGTALLPGTAFIELAMVAADAAGCGRVAELTLETPLLLPADGAVQIQITVGDADHEQNRAVEVHARPAGAGGEVPWTRHASGRIGPAGPMRPAVGGDFAVWPPPAAEPVPVEGLYEDLAAAGYGYGPSFRGLRAAWQRGGEMFAEVALPSDAAEEAGSYRLHPALLDAALHLIGLPGAAALPGLTGTARGITLPFSWQGVSLYATGASVLRVRLSPAVGGGVSLAATDGLGAPVMSVGALVLHPLTAGQLETGRGGLRDALFGVDWVPVPPGDPDAARLAVLGQHQPGPAEGGQMPAYPDLAALASAVAAGEPAPEAVLAWAGTAAGTGGGPEAARTEVGRVLGLVQEWLAADELGGARLVVATRGAVAAGPGEGVSDLAGAAVWGLVRSAQSENPGRLVLADLPAAAADQQVALAAALGSGEPELALRGQGVYGRRLTRPSGELAPPRDGGPWRLEVTAAGTLDGLNLVPWPEASASLAAGQVRVAVRAAGLNFRDVLIGLGMYPGPAVMGSELAGIVTGTGPGVTGLAPGDRVLGTASGAFGPVATCDARTLVPIPAGWSFARAASIPVAFATAWYGLVDLAGARPGQRLLVHAAAGGVGMAAVAIARYLGLDVYGTASPGKWAVLASIGLDQAHIASSRDTGFEARFMAATGGAGMDIVLNTLAGELTDASLRLLPHGGAFIELGKTDPRDPAQIAGTHPGVNYQAFDLGETGPQRMNQILTRLTGLLAAGDLPPLPVRAWDIRRARDAFRFMSQARHTGKLVLTIPPDPAAPREPGTALITGGTGLLGGLVAGHLAATGQASALLLVSRSGAAAPGAAALAAALAAAGTPVQVTACDTADRARLAAVLDRIPPASPLTTVIPAAGVTDDGVIGSLTPARVDAVMRPKTDAAWNLHQLTWLADLERFVLFSSAAAAFGGAGQGNYAAANAYLDGLAAHRQAAGQPAVSLNWGLWAGDSTLTSHLGKEGRSRITRGGIAEMTPRDALSLLDHTATRDEPLLLPARLDLTGLRTRITRGATVPPLWQELIPQPGPPVRPAASARDSADGLRRQLAAVSAAERDRMLLNLVLFHVAAVLGHASADAIEAGQSFTDIGFDSLTAVELRNRLNKATGLRLSATLIFDYPAPTALAEHLREGLSPDADGDSGHDDSGLKEVLASIPVPRLRAAGLIDVLLRLAREHDDDGGGEGAAIDTMDAESLIRMAFDNEGKDF